MGVTSRHFNMKVYLALLITCLAFIGTNACSKSPEHCKVSEWSKCEKGMKYRNVVHPAINGGMPCGALRKRCNGDGFCDGTVYNPNCCTKDNPCKKDEGDCDYSYQCIGDLQCGKDNCPEMFPTGADCCTDEA